MSSRFFLVPLTLALGAGFAHAQVAMRTEANKVGKQEYGIINFQTAVGSMKCLPVGELRAEGKIDVSFNGTLLVNGLEGKVTLFGNLRKEYENTKRKRVLYFGSGRAVIEGKFGGVQIFGREIKGTHNGFGIWRFYGEFDRNLNTGEIWYEGMPRDPMGTGGTQKGVPMPENLRRVVPKVKVKSAG
ncbi:MAG: hypothetical protein ACOYON_11325 [Fimbriimonas sp.]